MFSEDILPKLEAIVGNLESESSVEIVVAISPHSGNYRDIDHLVGFLGSSLFLFFALHSSVEFHVDTILLWMIAVYALLTYLGRKAYPLKRWMTSRARRRAQTVQCAQSSFVKNRVSSTRDRSGILLYLSAFEREAVLLADTGVVACVPPSELHRLERTCSSQDSLQAFERAVLDELPGLKSTLDQKLPRKEDDKNELSNAVVVETGALS